jgi:glycosyltransferase involved in cell wall biosynthesis
VLYFNDSLDNEAFKLYDSAGIRYFRIPRDKKKPIRFLKALSETIRQSQPDIVHCWLYSANIWGRLAAILAGHKNIIVAYRGGFLRYPFFMRCLEFVTHKKVHHLSNSWACANMTAAKTGLDPECFHVIYNGIDLKKFQARRSREEVRAELKITSDFKLVTMVGRLNLAKNYPMLLEAAMLCKKNGMPVRFCIAGHGELEAELKHLADKLNVSDTVNFLGLISDIPSILAASDIFCFTSNWEGFPNALLEAMAIGLPVITTEFNAVRELITGDDLGTVVPLNDAVSAVKAIKYYIDNPVNALTIGKNAESFVKAAFEMSTMVENSIEFYNRCLSAYKID